MLGATMYMLLSRAPGAALDLEHLIARSRMWIGGTVHDLCAVQGQGPSILGVRAFIGHHDAQAPNLCIDYRPEGSSVRPYFSTHQS